MEKIINTFAVGLVILSIFAFSMFMFNQYEIYQNQKEPMVINYKANVLIGLSPNANYREPTNKDIDTQLNLITPDGSKYRLFESRSLEKLDYGKTFVVKL